jgi:hypothetical protein
MTGRSKDRNPASSVALGVRAHSGWAAYVVLSGVVAAPDIRVRGIMQLCDPSIEGSKQPFHHAEPMSFGAAEKFIGRCKESSLRLAERAFNQIVSANGNLSGCCMLTASGRPLPGLREILASHALIHAAEGEFYRDVVGATAAQRGIPSERLRERDIAVSADRLPGNERTRNERLTSFGKQVGAPWRQDEKLAALAAWFALAMRPSRARSGTQTS